MNHSFLETLFKNGFNKKVVFRYLVRRQSRTQSHRRMVPIQSSVVVDQQPPTPTPTHHLCHIVIDAFHLADPWKLRKRLLIPAVPFCFRRPSRCYVTATPL